MEPLAKADLVAQRLCWSRDLILRGRMRGCEAGTNHVPEFSGQADAVKLFVVAICELALSLFNFLHDLLRIDVALHFIQLMLSRPWDIELERDLIEHAHCPRQLMLAQQIDL